MPIRPITRRSSDSQIFLPRPAHPHSSPTNPTSSSLCTAHQPISVALSVAVGVEPRGGRDHVGRPRRKWRAVATRACLVSPRRGPRRSTLPQRFLCVCSRGQERESGIYRRNRELEVHTHLRGDFYLRFFGAGVGERCVRRVGRGVCCRFSGMFGLIGIINYSN